MALIGAATIAGCGVTTIKGPYDSYRLIWHDEFNGPAGALPNQSKWKLWIGSPPNHELEYYRARPANASLDGHGDLAITALQQAYLVGRHLWHYTSGRLETLGHFQVKYGEIDARIKMPAGQGLWPTFWLLGNNYPRVGWPQSGEIDVMEAKGSDPSTQQGSVHGPARGPNGFQFTSFRVSPAPLNDGFNVYGVQWGPDKIVFTFDGSPYGEVTRSALRGHERWVFNRPFYLLLNLAVGGYFPGPPNEATRFPATLLVDWVRVSEGSSSPR